MVRALRQLARPRLLRRLRPRQWPPLRGGAPSLDRPEREDEAPDTIFLLTDGVPSEGRLQDPNFLLEYIGERNRDLQLRIHCISLTTLPAALEFMGRIARSLLYYELPAWAFTTMYVGFAALVIATLFLVPPRRAARGAAPG